MTQNPHSSTTLVRKTLKILLAILILKKTYNNNIYKVIKIYDLKPFCYNAVTQTLKTIKTSTGQIDATLQALYRVNMDIL